MAEQKQYRVEWANKNHQAVDWNRTIFTYESCFQLFRNTIRRGSKNSQSEVKRILKIVKRFTYGEQSVSKALLVIRSLGQISMVFILSILLNPIFYQVAQCSLNSGGDFNKIMIPKHTSGVAKEFIKNNVPELLECWANSSGLNSIENYWNVIKRRVEKRKPANINKLEQFMNKEIRKTD